MSENLIRLDQCLIHYDALWENGRQEVTFK